MNRLIARRLVLIFLLAAVASACSGSDDAETPETRDGPASTPQAVTGPLCDLLPAGTDPGGPATLTSEPADVALTWIPVLTNFEAGVRASGLAADLRNAKAVTILAPTDEAFTSNLLSRRAGRANTHPAGRAP